VIIDLNTVDTDPFEHKRFDICICGAGVAGITLALNLSEKLNICLLEAGGFDYSEKSQEIYQGNNIGQEYYDLMATRLRYFGGSTNHWKGWCRPLDSYDFEPKDHVKHSGWPIKREDLDPYLEKTKSILDIPKKAADAQAYNLENGFWIKPFFDLPPQRFSEFNEIDFWFSSPTRFGQKYKDPLKNASNITCILNANVTDITLSENLSRVDAVEVQNYKKRSFTAKVDKFILATGGIENPRIMLNCNRQIKAGLGNQTGLVGRFFTEHPHSKVGEFIFEDRHTIDSESISFFSPSSRFMQNEKILNFGLRAHRFSNPLHSSSNFKQKIKKILCDWSTDITSKVFSKECFNEGLLLMASEQSPNFSSRITLADELDKFGMKRANLDWRLSELDMRTIKRGAEGFAKEFASLGLGRVRIFDWLLADTPELPSLNEKNDVAGHHHMCTTRMGTSAQNGVVDSNQKVFGINNFYVAGSSVFPTGGHANPTLTITQMSLRLADHLNRMTQS
jgi:choline dehydrogenase-like flavoprotein